MSQFDRIEIKLSTFEAMDTIIKLTKEYLELVYNRNFKNPFQRYEKLYEIEQALGYLEEQKNR